MWSEVMLATGRGHANCIDTTTSSMQHATSSTTRGLAGAAHLIPRRSRPLKRAPKWRSLLDRLRRLRRRRLGATDGVAISGVDGGPRVRERALNSGGNAFAVAAGTVSRVSLRNTLRRRRPRITVSRGLLHGLQRSVRRGPAGDRRHLCCGIGLEALRARGYTARKRYATLRARTTSSCAQDACCDGLHKLFSYFSLRLSPREIWVRLRVESGC